MKTALTAFLILALAFGIQAAAAQDATTKSASVTAVPAPTLPGQDKSPPESHVGTTATAAAQALPETPAADPAIADEPDELQWPPVSTVEAGSTPHALESKVDVHDSSHPASAEAETQHSIARQVAAIGAALHADDIATARRQLDTLATQLPERSLTLLRMQAWYAHARGDTAGAIALYRDIVARLPADATAAINLAILEAGKGQPESARQRLQRLRALDTDSQRIENAIDQVGALLR